MTSRILVVDDDTALAEMIGIVLRTEGFETAFCADGAKAVDAWRSERPDLVLLDLMLPGIDGIEVCTRIRQESGIPIIMLTARTDTADVVKGLESGADDYIVKPFNPKELVARIRTRLRPASQPLNETLRIGDLTVDVAAHEVRRDDAPIALTPLEFELLVALASKPQQVFSREMLLEQVWGYHYKADTRLVNVHVQRLRAKVELDPDNSKIVTTVRGVGYREGGRGSSPDPDPVARLAVVARQPREPVAPFPEVPHDHGHARADRPRDPGGLPLDGPRDPERPVPGPQGSSADLIAAGNRSGSVGTGCRRGAGRQHPDPESDDERARHAGRALLHRHDRRIPHRSDAVPAGTPELHHTGTHRGRDLGRHAQCGAVRSQPAMVAVGLAPARRRCRPGHHRRPAAHGARRG